MKKTKLEIYGTLGPADCSKSILKQMFQAGMTGLRLNLSHTNLADCEDWLQNLYAVSEELHIVPDLLVDLQGPELRIGILPNPLTLEKDTMVYFVADDYEPSDFQKMHPIIPIPTPILTNLTVGQLVKLDDGKIKLEILSADTEGLPSTRKVCAKVITNGILTSRKSIAIDDCVISLPTLTKQDIENLKVLQKYHVTGVMLPFVRNKEDLLTLKKALLDLGLPQIRIFAKIENQAGVEQLLSLIPHCDQIVIARGDLGNAYPLSQLPAIQKEISQTCLLMKKPFMVVTQMLASMENAPVPTRAEVSDIFHAILDGATSVMLTGETAAGKYPVEAMQMFCDTAWEGLRYRIKNPRFDIEFR